MTRKEAWTRKNAFHLFLAVIFIALFLSAIIWLRTEKTGFPYPNGESYLNLRISEEVYLDALFDEDVLQERVYYPNPYHYLAAYAISFAGRDSDLEWMVVLMGALAAFLFYRLVAHLGFPKRNATFATLLLVVSPAFISLYTALEVNGLVLLLSLFVLNTYFSKKYWDTPWIFSGKVSFVLSVIALLLLALTSFYGYLLTIVFMAIISVFEKRGFRTLAIAGSVPLLLVMPLSLFASFLPAAMRSFDFHPFAMTEAFSILGARMGMDLFVLLLFITGMIFIWTMVRRMRIYHVFMLVLVAVSLFSPLLRLYAGLMMLVYCVFAMRHLYHRKWELEVVKSGTILLVACALVFSALSNATTEVKTEPGPGMQEVLAGLKALPEGVVLTEPDYGFLIQRYADKKTLLDGESAHYADYFYRLGDYRTITNSSRLKDVEPAMERQGVRYILITPSMKEGLWSGKEEELLFLVRNSESFRPVKETPEGYELWEYRPTA